MILPRSAIFARSDEFFLNTSHLVSYGRTPISYCSIHLRSLLWVSAYCCCPDLLKAPFDAATPTPMAMATRMMRMTMNRHHHFHFLRLRAWMIPFFTCVLPSSIYLAVFSAFCSACSTIGSCCSTNMARSWNICANSIRVFSMRCNSL